MTADPIGLSRVMTNLVMNAIRHTPADGTVEIRGRAVPDGVELSVSDQCGGISEDDMRAGLRRGLARGFRAYAGHAAELAGVGAPGWGSRSSRGSSRRIAASSGSRTSGPAGSAGCRFLVRLPA